jgi:hypothetical protein
MINANLAGRRARGRIFVSKAVILLCVAKKSRDADRLQNFVYVEMRGIDPDTLADDLRSAPEYARIPVYAFGCHPRRGRAMGTRPRRISSRPSRRRLCRLSKGCLISLRPVSRDLVRSGVRRFSPGNPVLQFEP